MSDLACWLLAITVYAVVVTGLLVIALGGNADLAKKNRDLRADNKRLSRQARGGLLLIQGGTRPRRPIVAATGREDHR